jgi:predicted MFS family arabinose efflux permease
MATLYGFAFFSHQVGSFLGVWLGAWFYDNYGTYDPVWWMSVTLGLAAAAIHWPIREQRAGAFVVAPAE